MVLVALLTGGIASATEVKAPIEDIVEEPVFQPQIWNYPVLIRTLYGNDNGQCVNYAKQLSKINYQGNAIEWSAFINSQLPELRSIVVYDTSFDPNGHLAVVVSIYEDHFIVSERNYEALWVVSTRSVEFGDPAILGFVSQ